MTKGRRLVLALPLAAIAAAGCGTEVVDQSSAQKRVTDVLKQNNLAATKVDCPKAGDTERKKGKTFQCTATVAGRELKLRVTLIDDKGRFTLQPETGAQ